jgi:hypothetical protein
MSRCARENQARLKTGRQNYDTVRDQFASGAR